MNGHYRFYSLDKFFRSIRDAGFRYCELWTGPMHFYMDYRTSDDPKLLKKMADRYGIRIIGICPEQTNPKPNNIAAVNPEAQERIYSYFCRAVDIASCIGSHMVTITPGWHYLDEDPENALKRSRNMLERIAGYAIKKDVTLVLEALQKGEAGVATTTSELKRLTKDIGSEGLKICIDFGAMAGAGENIDKYFACFPERIAHVHFVDGNPVGHLAWSDGSRNMKQDLVDLEKHGYTGYLSVESVNPRYWLKPWAGDKRTMETYLKSAREVEL